MSCFSTDNAGVYSKYGKRSLLNLTRNKEKF